MEHLADIDWVISVRDIEDHSHLADNDHIVDHCKYMF